jgi:hypothetical protein
MAATSFSNTQITRAIHGPQEHDQSIGYGRNPDKDELKGDLMSKQDITFSPTSEFGSALWAATTLGMSRDGFNQRLPKLQQEGFPKKDLLLKKFIKADVTAWVRARRQNSDTREGPKHTQTENEIQIDGL